MIQLKCNGMKCLLIALFSLLSHWAYSQDIREFFTSLEVNVEFVGLDFSQAKMVGVTDKNASVEAQATYFRAWNDLLLNETRKYDVKRAFMKRKIHYNFEIVDSLNRELRYVDLLTNLPPKSFSEKSLQRMVNRYDTQKMKSAYGVSFVVHSFNKFRERAYVYIVVFDVASKKILFSAQVSGETGGFGFRNYWARTIYNILEDVRDYKFRRWKEKIKRQSFVKR